MNKEASLGTIILITLLVSVIYLAYRSGVYTTQKEAIKAGVAEYSSDEEGNAIFKWKEHKNPPPALE
jgi:hypothetical protein